MHNNIHNKLCDKYSYMYKRNSIDNKSSSPSQFIGDAMNQQIVDSVDTGKIINHCCNCKQEYNFDETHCCNCNKNYNSYLGHCCKCGQTYVSFHFCLCDINNICRKCYFIHERNKNLFCNNCHICYSNDQNHCCKCELNYNKIYDHCCCSKLVYVKGENHCCVCNQTFDKKKNHCDKCHTVYGKRCNHCCDCKQIFEKNKNHCCDCKQIFDTDKKHCCDCNIIYDNKYVHCCKCNQLFDKNINHCCNCNILFGSSNNHCCVCGLYDIDKKHCENCHIIYDNKYSHCCECSSLYKKNIHECDNLKCSIKNILISEKEKFNNKKFVITPFLDKSKVHDLFINGFKSINKKYDSLEAILESREYEIVYHGTNNMDNIISICCNGWNITNRGKNGQVHGQGEYFSNSIKTPLKFSDKGAIIATLIPSNISQDKIKKVQVNDEIYYIINNNEKEYYCLPIAIIQNHIDIDYIYCL
jgi:hypothetical protein